jgi:hypothetical protein
MKYYKQNKYVQTWNCQQERQGAEGRRQKENCPLFPAATRRVLRLNSPLQSLIQWHLFGEGLNLPPNSFLLPSASCLLPPFQDIPGEYSFHQLICQEVVNKEKKE